MFGNPGICRRGRSSTSSILYKDFPFTVRSELSLIINSDVAEQVGHGLAIVDAADGLGQDHAHIHRLDLRALQFLHLMWDGVRYHHLLKKTFKSVQNYCRLVKYSRL